MPACSKSWSLRGEAEASTSFGLKALRVARARCGGGAGGASFRCSGSTGFGLGSTVSARFSLSLFKAVSDPTFSEIIGRHLDQNFVTGKHPDAVLAHASRRMGDDLVIVLEFLPEGGVGEQFRHHSRKFEHLFLRHKAPSASFRSRRRMVGRAGKIKDDC
jgi:hypothetical protein